MTRELTREGHNNIHNKLYLDRSSCYNAFLRNILWLLRNKYRKILSGCDCDDIFT